QFIGEKGLNLLRAVIKYTGEFPSHLEAVGQAAKQSERKSIFHCVRDQGAALNGGKPMRVAPMFVRALRLDINEFVRWIPQLYLRQPTQWNSAKTQRGDGCSPLHYDRRRSEN